MSNQQRNLRLNGTAKARILPKGSVNEWGFFSTTEFSKASSLPTTEREHEALTLRCSPLDPRAWSSILTIRYGHLRDVDIRFFDSLGEACNRNDVGVLPDVVLYAGGDVPHTIDGDWRLWSRILDLRESTSLYPERSRGLIDELDDVIDRDLVEGLFAIIWASSHDEALHETLDRRDFLHGAQTHAVLRRVFYARLGWLDRIVAHTPYLLGETITDADLHLFGLLLTFDIGYRSALPAPDAAIVDYPYLWDYARRIYRTDGLVLDDEKRALGLLPDTDGSYRQPWGPVAFTETADSIRDAWNA